MVVHKKHRGGGMHLCTKHALAILTKRYRSVLIKCFLASLMLSAGAMMSPRAASAALDVEAGGLILNADVEDEYMSIGFASADAVLDGNGQYAACSGSCSETGRQDMQLAGDGTLKDITLKADKITGGYNKIYISGNVTFDTTGISGFSNIIGKDESTLFVAGGNLRYASNAGRLYFTNITMKSSENDLTIEGHTTLKDGHISVVNDFYADNITFTGETSLTASKITVSQILTVINTLTISGNLYANLLETDAGGGTLKLTLPKTASSAPIVFLSPDGSHSVDCFLDLNLKNVSGGKTATRYVLTNRKEIFTISADYPDYAFSASEFTKEDYLKNEEEGAFSLVNAWNASVDGSLWILKIAGKDGAQGAIDDLRNAGVSVSDAEESASKILDITSSPYADVMNDLLDSGDLAVQKQALREIVPTDAAQSSYKTAKNVASSVLSTVSGRLGGGAQNTPAASGRSGGDLTAGRATAWAQGMFNHAKLSGSDGFKSDTAGFAAGIEAELSDSFMAGFGYAYASTDVKSDRSKTDADTHTGFVYGEYRPNAFYANATLAFGRSDYDDKTRLSGMDSSYKADTYSARIAAGYKVGVVTPQAALDLTRVHLNAYTDALGARVSSKNMNTATAELGVKVEKEMALGAFTVIPQVNAAAAYDISRSGENRFVALPDGTSYVVSGDPLHRFGVKAGAGVKVKLGAQTQFEASYDGNFKNDYADHTGLISIRYEF